MGMPHPAAECTDPCDMSGADQMVLPCSHSVGERIFNSSERMAKSKAGMEEQHAKLLVHQIFLAGQDKPDLIWRPREYRDPSA